MKGKVALVTGAASGIGLAIANELAANGCVVALADHNVEGLQSAIQKIQSAGGRASAHELDVTRTDESEKLIQEIVQVSGRLDYFFNNAGIGISGEVRDLARGDWEKVLAVNFSGMIHMGNEAFKIMAKQGFGHIVNTASASGLIPFPAAAPYSTSKFGIVGYSQNLRIEGSDLGVKVTVLCPGFIESNIYNSPSVNVKREEAFSLIKVKKIPADVAARKILRGVEKNRAIVIFPFYVHLLYWIHRHIPRLSFWISKQGIREFRKIRREGVRE